jgi:hypothetical protein
MLSNTAATCGSRARIYCFSCGDFVQHHKVFANESDRVMGLGAFRSVSAIIGLASQLLLKALLLDYPVLIACYLVALIEFVSYDLTS